ncbi:winged helix DNA-binding domain-containing protein [Glaciihabitans sp. dw_435]|uniref:winged helix DNA-binding domain-containing protein n=1 Tax=Glaciihabitans sp. dw_435 TaxID=2720081 RepID=UPI001BD6A7C2|nr:winged helix DNA-binding domain-containing protein [Glaciihabitans sp. dw_435]
MTLEPAHPVAVTPRELLRLRLASQRIESPSSTPLDVAGVVRHLLALQAQDFAQGLWAVALRAPGATKSDVLAALDEGRVIRSWPMRGTLHFLPPEDLRWILALTAERTLKGAASRFRGLGIDETTLTRATEVARAELGGGARLSRDELFAALGRAGIDTAGQRGSHIVFALSHRAIICWGPTHKNQQALVLVDDWIPRQPARERTDALRSYALGYFRGHGPATLADFAWWSKLTLADARTGLAAALDDLVELSCDGTTYWMTRDEMDAAGPAPSRASGRVHLLPGFDEYLLGYTDRSLALTPEHFDRVVPGTNGIFLPIIVSRGRVVGTWRRPPGASPGAIPSGSITTDVFETLGTRDTATLDRAAREWSRYAAG